MGTNIELQYKLLNAELMAHVQKLRVEVGEYRKLVVNLQLELLEERESRILEMDHKKRQLKYAISGMIKDWDLGEDISVGSAQTPQEEYKSPPASRRSNAKEICNEMRRLSDMTRSSRTCSSPTGTSPSSRSSRTLRGSSRSSSGIVTTTDVNATTVPEETERLNIDCPATPRPRRIAEMTSALDDTDEDSPTIADVVDSPTCVDDEKLAQNDQAASLFSILEESDTADASDNSSTSSTSVEILDTTETPTRISAGRGRVLRELCGNVAKETPFSTCGNPGKAALTISCPEEDSSQELSVQLLRQHLSPMPMNISIASPRQSMFNGICCESGSTSTPHSFPVVQERGGGRTRTRLDIPQETVNVDRLRKRLQSTKVSLSPSQNSVEEDQCSTSTPHFSPVDQRGGRGRPRTHFDIPQDSVNVNRLRKRLESTNDSLSPSQDSIEEDQCIASCSTKGRPSRKCRPTSLKEPKLNTKMRNESLSKSKS
ncbi:shugoshin [Drosophila obscura]|uniref:shugoshin n=1 Tax=Drosophila obscura TaxID=7282 RepID=UPI001BB27155|nr:shugoshin [Drosophila obscura]